MPRVSPNQGEGGGDEGQGPGFNWDKLAKKLDQQHQVYQPPQQPQPAQVTSTQPIQRVTPAQINQQAQQVIQAPVPQSYIDQMTPTWNDLVKGRSTAFQSQYWTASPYLWTQLVTARYREQTITKLADKLPGMDAWVRQQDAFGGHPGALTQLRAKALNIPNPVVRIQALTEIDALAALDPETQTQFLAQMSVVQNHDVTALQPRKSSSETIDTTESPALDEGFQQLLGDQYAGYDQTTGDLALHAEVGQTPALDPVQQAALHDLFPQLFERNQQFGRIVSLTDVARSVAASQAINEAAYAVGSPIADQLGNPSSVMDAYIALSNPVNLLKNPLGAGESGMQAAGVLTGAVTKPVSAVGHVVENKVPGGTVAGGVLGVPLRIGELALNAASTAIGDTADATHYAATGSHLDDSTKQFWGNLGLIVVLHEASEVAGTASKTLAGPAEYTEGTIEGVPTEGSMVQNTLADGQWRSAIAHPLDTYLDPLVRQGTFDAIQKLRSTETSNWVTWGRTTDLFKTVESTVDELGPEKAKAALTSSYPSFGRQPGLLDTLVDARKASAMPQAVMDLADGVKTAGLEEQLAKIDTAVKATQEQIASATTADTLPSVGLQEADLNAGRPIEANQVKWVRTQDLVDATPVGEPGSATHLRYERAGTDIPQLNEATGEPYPQSLQEHISTEGHPKPIEVSVDENGQLKIENGNHALSAAIAKGDEYVPVYVTKAVPEDMPLQEKARYVPPPAELPPGIQALSTPEETLGELQDRLDGLKAQRVELRSQASEVYTQGKFYEFPNRRTLPDYLHRVFYRPTTLSEQILRKLLNPMSSGKLQKWSNKLMGRTLDAESQAFLEKWTDKIGQEDKLRAPHLASTPADRAAFNDMNTTYLNRLFKRFGVSEADRVATLSKVMGAPDAQQFWEAVTRDVFGNDGILAKYMPKNTPQVWRDSFLGRYDVNSNNLRGWITDENGIRQPVIPGETKYGKPSSLPGAPSEFASYVPLPSAGELDRILSGYRRLADNLHHASKFPTLANAAGYALDFNRAVVHVSTSILKPVALIANLPAIILTKQIDEGLGNVASPGIRGTFRAGSEADSVVGAIPPEITGNAFAGAFQDTPTGVPGYMPVATRDIIANGMDSEQANLVYATQSQILTGITNDPFYSQFARDGFDVAKMKDRMSGTDAAMTHHYRQNLSVSLDRAGMSLDEYLPRVEQYLREATFDNPDYLGFIKDGKLSPVGSLASREWHGEVEADLYNKWLSQRAEMSDVRAAMNQLDREGASAEFRAHQAHLKDLMEQVDDTEAKLTEFGGVPEDKLPVIDRTRPQALANDIRNRFSTGEIKLPDETWVSANAKHPWSPGAKNALEAADEMAQKFSNYIYGRDGVWSFRQVGRAEGKFARGSFYEQRGLQYYKGFKALGYSDADATAFARLRAGIQARDMFYDLTARSSAERALRNIFWFAPVNAELMYRWLYAIPAQAGGLIPGALITGARAEAWDKMLKQTGIVQVNADGQQVLPISGMGSFLNMVSGGKVKMPDTLQIPLASLNPHLTSPIPQLSPLPALALHQVSDHVANSRFNEYAPVLKTLSNAVAQHSFTSFVPNSIRNAYGFFTGKPGMWSNDAIQQQFDHAHDVALQYAAHDLQVQGILPPVPPGSKVVSQAQHDEYMQQLAAYQQQLYPLADDYARGTFLISTLSSAVVPGYITASDKDQKAYQDWYKNTIAPQLDLNNGQMSSAVRQQWMRWMHNHPNSLAFSASYSEYTGKTYQPDVARTDQEYYTQLYLHNVKATMSPDDYQEVLPALMSHTLMEARLQGNLNKIAPDNSPATMLRNWGQHSRAIGDYQIQWQNYLDQNPRARDLIQENKDGIAAEYPDSIAADSVERTYVQQALQTLSRLAPKFTGESNMPESEYKTVVSKLKEINANLYTATGGDLTPMEQGISWYFDNVLDPYFKQTNALYNKASQLQAAGLSQGDVYSRIDRIKNSFNNGLSYGGEKYPTIDEFFYGTKTPTEQKYAVTSWMTKPTSWLSDWQRKKVGYGSFNGEDQMFQDLNALDARTQAFIEQNKVYPGSNWADAITKWQQNQAHDIAVQYGKQGLSALKLEQADPYVRLRSFGYGGQNASMQEVYKMVDYTQSQLTKAGLSPGGYSDYATSLKLWVYNYIAKQEAADPKFSDLMQRLEFSTSPLGGAQSNPTGVPLWEAIFYGNYNPSFIPQSLIDAAPRGSDVT